LNVGALITQDVIGRHISFTESAFRLAIAVICAAIVGWDRESHGRAAGLRTFIMVALGSAGFTIVAVQLFAGLQATSQNVSGDPIRIMAAIVGGIGFLGAGAIIQSGGQIHGLTTAAGLWVIAAVGLASGSGYYALAVLVTVTAFLTLRVLRRVEQNLPERVSPTQDDHNDGDASQNNKRN
jgi:putative Mg2+ transporter-C (MgtC) family protein